MFLTKAQKDVVAMKSLVKRITKTLIFSLSLCTIKMHMHVCKALGKDSVCIWRGPYKHEYRP